MAELDLGLLRADVLVAARTAITELRAEYDDLCGYALYSDGDAGTVCLALDRRGHADGEDGVWATAEWALEGVAEEHFDELCERLFEAGRHTRDFAAFRAGVYEACVLVLEDLIAEGTIPAGERVVTFTVSDDWTPERENGWVRRLNPPEVAARHTRWALG